MYNNQMKQFDGKEHAKKLEKQISDFLKHNVVEGELAIIQIGGNKSSEKYTAIKKKVCDRLGIACRVYKLNKEKLDLEYMVQATHIIYSPSVKSVIIQLPLPTKRLESLLTKIPRDKDVDVLSEGAKKKFYSGDFSIMPPVVRAVEYFIYSNKIDVNDKNITMVGYGDLVGKPVGFFLEKQGSKVKIVEENYSPGVLMDSDLVILAAGVSNLVKGEDIKSNCDVIDFGSSIADGKFVGDLDLSSKLSHLGNVSPSPGGMGPLVVRFLIMNHLGI